MASTKLKNWEEKTRAKTDTLDLWSPHAHKARQPWIWFQNTQFVVKQRFPAYFLFVDPFKGSYFIYQETISIIVSLLLFLQTISYFKEC